MFGYLRIGDGMTELITGAIPNRKDILELAMHDPILHRALTYWEMGECTFEEALMMSVVVLEKLRHKQGDLIHRYMSIYGALPEE